MKSLKAMRPHFYNHRMLQAGDLYQPLDAMHGMLLVAFGHATLVEENPAESQPETAEIAAVSEVMLESPPERASKRRTGRRHRKQHGPSQDLR